MARGDRAHSRYEFQVLPRVLDGWIDQKRSPAGQRKLFQLPLVARRTAPEHVGPPECSSGISGFGPEMLDVSTFRAETVHAAPLGTCHSKKYANNYLFYRLRLACGFPAFLDIAFVGALLLRGQIGLSLFGKRLAPDAVHGCSILACKHQALKPLEVLFLYSAQGCTRHLLGLQL